MLQIQRVWHHDDMPRRKYTVSIARRFSAREVIKDLRLRPTRAQVAEQRPGRFLAIGEIAAHRAEGDGVGAKRGPPGGNVRVEAVRVDHLRLDMSRHAPERQ